MTPDVEEARLARAMSEMAPVVDRYDLDAAAEGAGREIWHRVVADVDAVSHEGHEAVPGFEMGDRKGRPYAGLVAELFV